MKFLQVVRTLGGFKPFVSVLGGNLFNNLVTFAVTVLVAHLYGTQEFGKFAFATSIVILVGLILDLGMSITLVRQYNQTTDSEARTSLVRVVLQWKLLLLMLFTAVAFPIAKLLVGFFPTMSGAADLLAASIISGALLSIWSTVRSVEQAQQDFGAYAAYTFIYGGLRIVCSIPLVLGVKLPIGTVLAGLYAFPLVFLLSIWCVKHRLQITPLRFGYLEYSRLKEIFSYSFWVAISIASYNLMTTIPQLVLARRGSSEDVGVYGAAATFITGFSLINESIRTMLLPKVTGLSSSQARHAYRRGLIKASPIFFGAALTALIAIVFVQEVLLGRLYATATPISVILGLCIILNMFLGLLNTLVHSHGIPKTDAFVNVGRLLLVGSILWVIRTSVINVAVGFGSMLVMGELGLLLAVFRHEKAESSNVTFLGGQR